MRTGKTEKQITEIKEQLVDKWYEENKFKSDCPRDKQSFIEGFSANKKLTDKIILDSLNKYKSSLANEQRVKLTKIVNYEKVKLLESQIEVLLEIQNKLSPKD